MSQIENPVLRGFNPDPSAVIVNGTTYIAVSTFEWMPGIRIYKTSDLLNYEYVTDVLVENDFRGNPKDCSIWAPQLSYVDNEFYLLYTEVKSTVRPFKDTHNYLIKANKITGPWSKPIYLNSSGFDPSLYHEKDKSYLLNCQWDYRHITPNKSVGIMMQEFDRKTNKLTGNFKNIFKGTSASKTEAPNIYKIGEYYYLLTAEGGTGEDHQVTVCRSKDIFGPYEVDPNTPLLTSKDNPNLNLQCAGHASLIIMPDNSMYIYHLATRPIDVKYPILGRETAIQEVVLEKSWLRLKNGGNTPFDTVEVKEVEKNAVSFDFYDDFSSKKLHYEWNLLRTNNREFIELGSDGLTLISKESLQSLFDVSLVGKRITNHKFSISTKIMFQPRRYNQLAGIGLYLNSENFFYVYLTYDEKIGKCARYFKKDNNEFFLYDLITPIKKDKTRISIHSDGDKITVTIDDEKQNILEDIRFLSGGFTGLYAFLSVHDQDYQNGSRAIFKWFSYKE